MMERRECLHRHTKSPEETGRLAELFGARIDRGLCILLSGGLGTGKTVFVRGLCRGLGVDEQVLSPTFTLYEEYRGRLRVVHLDLYRVEHESEVEALGVFDLMGEPDVVLAVEWGERSETLSARADAVIKIAYAGDSGRDIRVAAAAALSGVFARGENE